MLIRLLDEDLICYVQASKSTVGFIGLGNMGSRMAENLLKNEFKVIAYDVVPAARKDLESKGAEVLL